MPTLTRWFVKTAMLYFLASFLIGGGSLVVLTWKHQPLFAVLQPVYWHLLIVGWLMQLIFGVAYWMFPAFSRDQPHGSETAGWATYGALNLGLLLRVIFEPWHALQPAHGLGWLLVPAALLQVGAGWLFVWNTWGRIRSRQR